MKTIPEMAEKGKQVLMRVLSFELVIGLSLVFVGLSAFGLGRLSATESIEAVTLSSIPLEGSTMPAMPIGGGVVASKTGSAYYFPWCSGATRIKSANVVWFSSKEDAERAGYAPAKNCKGLVSE